MSPCLFKLYAEHVMRNPGLEELQAGIKIGGKTSTTSDRRMIPFNGRKQRGAKEPPDEGEGEV